MGRGRGHGFAILLMARGGISIEGTRELSGDEGLTPFIRGMGRPQLTAEEEAGGEGERAMSYRSEDKRGDGGPGDNDARGGSRNRVPGRRTLTQGLVRVQRMSASDVDRESGTSLESHRELTVSLPIRATIDAAGSQEHEGPEEVATIEDSPGVSAAMDDAVAASVTFRLDKRKGQVDLTGEFGHTDGNVKVKDQAARPVPRGKKFEARMTVVCKIRWDTQKDTGPHGQTNIESEKDPDITQKNYEEIAKDLTPGSDDVPPRTKFWAKDITVKHETFHLDEWENAARDAARDAEAWLNSQSAKNLAGAKKLVRQASDQIEKQVRDKTKDPEPRANAAVAPDHKQRADAIRAKGRRKGYEQHK